MNKMNRMATSLMTVALIGSAPFSALAQTQSNSTPDNSPSAQRSNTPPAGTEQAQQGFRDGIEAAKLDTIARRKIDAKSSHLYLHPPVKGADVVNAYRQQFVIGYDAAVKHGIQLVRAVPAG